jgi:arylsulfatase A-like enzyme
MMKLDKSIPETIRKYETLERIGEKATEIYRRVENRFVYLSRVKQKPIPKLGTINSKNVLIITIDCLRNDRISRSGYDRKTTPFLDSFDSFTPAIAGAPWTFSSVPSILTGLYPHRHGAGYEEDSSRNYDHSQPPNGVRDDVYTIAEILGANGYNTKFLTAIGTASAPIRGRFKQMELYHDAGAGTLLSDMTHWWNNESSPKLGYVQLGDLHEPLHEPEQLHFGEIPDINGLSRWRYTSGNTNGEKAEDFRSARELLYDSVLRDIDKKLEKSLDNLTDMNDTVVIITSDHGEEFWEYQKFEETHFEDSRGVQGFGHGHALVPPVIEVPILTNVQGIASSDSMRSSTDIVPTILYELGVNISFDLDGYPLQESPDDREAILSEEIAYGPNQISATQSKNHLIYIPSKDKHVMIDFKSGELVGKSGVEEHLLQQIPEYRISGTDITVSKKIQNQLSELGYAE